MDGLRWLLAGLGLVVLALIYLWGIRARLREQLRERRRRAARLSDKVPVLEAEQPEPAGKVAEVDFGHLGKVGPDHHLADKILVDVEITPVKRAETKSAAAEPATGQPAAVDVTPVKRAEAKSAAAEPATGQPAKPESLQEYFEQAPVSRKPPSQPAETPGMPHKTVLLTVMAPQGKPFKGGKLMEVAQETGLHLSDNGVFDYFPSGQQNNPLFSIAHLREPGIFAPDTLETLTTPGLLLFMQLPASLDALAAVDSMVTLAKRLAQKLDGSVCDERRNKISPQFLVNLRNEAAEFERRQRVQLSRH